MGHQHLGRLPKTRNWQQVIRLISEGAAVNEVAAATSAAAERQMGDASDDPAIRRAVWLLTQIPLAARQDDFGSELRRLGLPLGNSPTLLEVSAALSAAIDSRIVRTGGRTDLGEMAQLSAVESLNAIAGRELPDFFGPEAERAKVVLAGLATVKQFAVLSRDFFSRLTHHLLLYFLSRELSLHVGPNSRFRSLREHKAFLGALDEHCREASRIVKEFSGQWFSKANFEGGITEAKAGHFAHVAFGKMRDELQHRRSVNA